ncbi:type II toxin-antitoxin system RelB/DinJ family antitoxin [Pseudoramibacter sp.]|jgi:DNA-damage-inducible protein J|uniref:type II toxin-antitoxin system RelB/DinJ family antitoxin n=1 Tax=Pseudoramibacter sp. TaxID=2034862 RepID=UPI0025FD53C4|nr:type II toxin-antitoxin system RelB/DinJ family antitoxin [Pseudoramibacter sp.]MCH4072366.1 type II toxin-antitoxin system RelB/DinJ family antitoxin [Pseudoramibacter sp.]MCH4106137.1 type II toxin-antitoxin system RelB/DinJ family antitoxin [Pseudoramibacter sp.]
MTMTNVNIRMDSNLKKQFAAFCDDIGMSMTTAFNVFAKQALREHRIPFEIGEKPYNEETNAAIAEARFLAKHPEVGKTFDSLEALIKDLESDSDD